MNADITAVGVFGMVLKRGEQIAMLPFYMAHVMGKDIFCHYTMLNDGEMSDIGFMKSKQLQHLIGLTECQVFDIPQGENITAFIDKAVREAEHRSALFFRWEKDVHNDSYFFSAINASPQKRPVFLDEIGLTATRPFSAITRVELEDATSEQE